MKFTDFLHKHSRSLLFVLAVLAAFGAIRSFSLPVALFPNVSFPRVRVTLDSGDQPAERMAIEVTAPVEEALGSIPGLRGLRSTSSRGSAEISVNFDWGDDMTAAKLEVQTELNRILPSLPQGTTFEVERMDPNVFPVIAYSLTSSSHSQVELRDLAQYTLRPTLSTVRGVASVTVQGGKTAEYRVVVDPAKLQSVGMTLDEVASALSAANVVTAVGKVEDRDKLYLVISDTRLRDFPEIKNTVVHSGSTGLVLLSSIATVESSSQPQWTRVTADGRDAVLIQVYQQPGGNTVQIAAGIKQKLEELKARIPAGVSMANWYDQSDLIVASANSTRDAVLIGIGLAALVLIAFLRNFKITIVATLAVPVVLAATMVLLSALNMSFNIMTLGGMAAAVGLIIDDTIVMLEHIMRRLHSGNGAGVRLRVLGAADEFTRPLAGSSAATIVIFLPLAFLSGVTGAFFKALSLTMAASLVISYLVAWLAMPLLAARVLSKGDHRENEDAPPGRIHRGYAALMKRLLATPALALLFIIPLLVGGWLGYRNVASGFIPVMDEGGFILDYVAHPGTSLGETDRLARQVEAILQTTPEVETYSRRTGLQLGGGITEPNTGDMFVRLKPLPRRPIEEVMDEVRRKVERNVPGLEIETAQLMEDLIGDLTSVPQPIEIKLFSEKPETLKSLAPKVAAAIEKVRGVVEVKNGIVLAGDALTIEIDRVKAALEGMDPETITKALDTALSGKVAANLQRGSKLVGLRVWIPKTARRTESNLENLLIRAPDGHLFPVGRVAHLKTVTGQAEIARENLQRMVAVTGRISGRDLGSTVDEIKQGLRTSGIIPKEVSYSIGGLYEQQQIAFAGLTKILIAAVILVFLLLLFLYESFRVAFAMLTTTLLAVAGVYLGLWITGTEFNITSRMGMTMIVGIVTEVAIFYFSEYVETPASPDRYIVAGLNRMRPIAMTTFAAILALLPLALGVGQGAAMQQPLAIAIISGLVFQLPLALIILPAILAFLKTDAAEGSKRVL